jgi:hypothetical protein
MAGSVPDIRRSGNGWRKVKRLLMQRPYLHQRVAVRNTVPLYDQFAQVLDLEQVRLGVNSSCQESNSPRKYSGFVIQSLQIGATSPQPCSPLNSSESLLASRLVKYLSVENPTGLSISYLSSFLDFIHARLGINKALDSIVECLCATYCQMLTKNDEICKNDAKQYSKALGFLRRSLHNEREALSSEVLCSVVLLSWYEVNGHTFDRS